MFSSPTRLLKLFRIHPNANLRRGVLQRTTDGDPENTPHLSYEATQRPLNSLLATTSWTSPEISAEKGQTCGNDGACLHKGHQLCPRKAFLARVEVNTGTASKDRGPEAHCETRVTNTELRSPLKVQNLKRAGLGTQGGSQKSILTFLG